VGFDNEHCGCILSNAHNLPCACGLDIYDSNIILVNEVRIMWTKLSFSLFFYVLSCDSFFELSIQQEFDAI